MGHAFAGAPALTTRTAADGALAPEAAQAWAQARRPVLDACLVTPDGLPEGRMRLVLVIPVDANGAVGAVRTEPAVVPTVLACLQERLAAHLLDAPGQPSWVEVEIADAPNVALLPEIRLVVEGEGGIAENAGILGALRDDGSIAGLIGAPGLQLGAFGLASPADLQLSVTRGPVVLLATAAAQTPAGGPIETCLATRAGDRTRPDGRLEGTLTVRADGSVRRVRTHIDEWGEPELTGCVEGALSAARLPEAGKGKATWALQVAQQAGAASIVGDPIILGALDKAVIDEGIRRNMKQIRYCYQRALTETPTLAGKLTVKFVIAADGTVSSATTKASTLDNAALESCVNGRVMRFSFPAPAGGGIVIVSYPFVFEP